MYKYIQANKNNIYIFLLIFSFFFTSVLRLPFFGSKIQFCEIIFLFILPFSPIKRIFSLQIKENKIIFLSFLIFLSFEMLSSILSKSNLSILTSFGRFYLLTLFSYFYYYFDEMFISNNNYQNKLIKIFSIVIIFLFIITIIGLTLIILEKSTIIFSYFVNYPYFGSVYRLQGFNSGPNFLANLIILFTLLLIGFISKNIKNKWGIFFIILISLFCLILTFSKSIITFTLGILIILFFKIFKLKKRIILLISSLFFIIYIFISHLIVTSNNSNLQESLKSTNFTSDKILYQYNETIFIETGYTILNRIEIDIIRHNFLFGVGPGNFYKQLNYYRKTGFYPNKLPDFDPHSTYLGLFSENGIFGFSIFIFILIYIFNVFYNSPYLLNDNLIFALFLIFIIFLIEGTTTDILNYRHFWFFLALSLSILNNKIKINNLK